METSTGPLETKVIAIGNQKGGIGKTTNTCNLAVALAERGRRVLVFDLDVNAGATLHFGIQPEEYLGTFHVLTGACEPDEVIITGNDPDVDIWGSAHLIPAQRDLEQLDQALRSNDPFFTPSEVLRSPIQKLRGRYDYILLDTAPNAPTTTIGAYMAADYFIISTFPERFSVAGVKKALADLRRAQRPGRNEQLELLGIIVCAVDIRVRRAREYVETIRTSFVVDGDSKMFPPINRAAIISKAQDTGQTVIQFDPGHRAAQQYRATAHEIELRIGKHRARTEATERRPSAQSRRKPAQENQGR